MSTLMCDPCHFMANRWRNSENSGRLFFFWGGGSKITANGDWGSHEIKRCLLLGKKVMTNLESIFKSRDITLPSKQASEVVQSCPTLCNPMDSSLHQAPLSMGFSRQEYWSGLPFPSPRLCFFLGRRFRPHLRITLDPPGLDTGS